MFVPGRDAAVQIRLCWLGPILFAPAAGSVIQTTHDSVLPSRRYTIHVLLGVGFFLQKPDLDFNKTICSRDPDSNQTALVSLGSVRST